MALQERFKTIDQGAMVLTGNSLVIFGPTAYPASGGNPFNSYAYISTDTSNQITNYPVGTTTDVTKSSSMAVLNIPSGSTILYATLMWTFNGPSGQAGNSVTFTTPVRTSTVAPTLSDTTGGTVYWRAADVKTLVQEGMSGNYTVGGVPGNSVGSSTAITNAWNLLVVYRNDKLPFRYFNVNTGMQTVSNTSQATYNFSNFTTPTIGSIKGYLLMSYSAGDLADQAQLRIGAASPGTQVGNTSTGTWNGLSPYNPKNNMFPAIICNADTQDPNIGLLDTRGSFGAYNMNPYDSSVPAFGRVLADIAGIDISSALTNNQNNVYTNVSFAGSGSAVILSESIQIDVNSVDVRNITKTVDKNYADIGDTLTYTITFNNAGKATAQNLVFIDTVPNGATFVPNSLYVNYVLQPGGTPNAPGISLNNVASGVYNTISFKVQVTGLPSPNPIQSSATLGYNFIPAPGQNSISGNTSSAAVATTINHPILNITKTPDKSYGSCNDVITYTIVATNTGSTTAKNVILKDTLPNKVSFIPNSMYINGVQSSGSLPNISIGDLAVNVTSTVSFKVSVQC